METIPEDYQDNEFENAMNVYPDDDAFEPYTRPPREVTNITNFPPGFSPFDDKRDPGADPNPHPPPQPKLFEEFLGRGRANVEESVKGWPHLLAHIWESLFPETALEPLWEFWNRNFSKHVTKATGAVICTTFITAAPLIFVYLYARLIDLWRHGIGGWFYTFYYLTTINGQPTQTKCWRVLKEGPSHRFTVTSQFWFRRGCEGAAGGFLARGHLTEQVSVTNSMKSLHC
jgi:hypothetical protein